MKPLAENQPCAIEMEKSLLSALLLKDGEIIPKVAAILAPDDFYRAEHQIIFRTVTRVYFSGTPLDILAVEDELKKTGELERVNRRYLFSLVDLAFSTAHAEFHAKTIKAKADLRKLVRAAQVLADDAQKDRRSPADIIADTQRILDAISRSAVPSQKTAFADFFANHFNPEVAAMKAYADRRSGFFNLDQQQFFSPGLYVIGATPAAGKTTFCWQLLEQMARRGETCIYCSYEMSRLELFAKSVACELFKRAPYTDLTAAGIRRGSWSAEMNHVVEDFAAASLDLSVLELQDETVDALLALLKPLCSDKQRAPIVCLDYLQIVPTARDSTKLGIDETVRKLKKFQRDTNTTFFVISSFNRMNYAQYVSFESFKESGNIEYTADVVWALQLNMMNNLKGYNDIAETRKRIEQAKKQQPRQINLKCLKNRQGTNYDCFFNYHSAHDCFEPCDKDDFNDDNSFSGDD